MPSAHPTLSDNGLSPAGADKVEAARRNENFPVASRLVRASLRPHVLAFYRFVRTADDIADDPATGPVEKRARLDALEAGLTGRRSGPAVASALRESLTATGISDRCARNMLDAFRRDVEAPPVRDWGDLLLYCRSSANPVGRYLLALHGEDEAAAGAASDALCSALQILNHLQDCGDDFRRLGRVYLPREWLRAAACDETALGGTRCAPTLRAVLDRVLDGIDELLRAARPLPALIRDRRLRLEAAVIVAVAERLARRLRRHDPLARSVRLSTADRLSCLFYGLLRGLTARPAR